MTSDNDKYENALETVDNVGQVPNLLGSSDQPGDDLHDPRDAHYDDQFQANPAQCCSAGTKENSFLMECSSPQSIVITKSSARILVIIASKVVFDSVNVNGVCL